VTQKYAKKNEMLTAIFVGSLCTSHAVVFENCRCAWNRSTWRPDFKIYSFSDHFPIFIAHRDCLPKMGKFVYKNINHNLFETKCSWLSKPFDQKSNTL